MAVEQEVIPLVEERAFVSKRRVETGRVQVRTRVQTHEELVRAELTHDEVVIERVPVNRPIEGVPAVRDEGDVTIVPIVAEVAVIEKRLMLIEEIHLRRVRTTEEISQPVTLAAQQAEITRHDPSGDHADRPSNR